MSSPGIFDFSLSEKSTESQSLSKVGPCAMQRIDEDYRVMKPVFVVHLLLSHIVLSLTVVCIQNMIRRGKYILRSQGHLLIFAYISRYFRYGLGLTTTENSYIISNSHPNPLQKESTFGLQHGITLNVIRYFF